MKCDWHSYLNILPPEIRRFAEQYEDCLLECRMRLDQQLAFVTMRQIVTHCYIVTQKDIHFVINVASHYSPWAATSMQNGFLTANGGHRIGICGETVCKDGLITGISNATSLCIRVARDISGISRQLEKLQDNLLIIGCPGSGKTTLLRDLIRAKSSYGFGPIGVVDERRELFPVAGGRYTFDRGTSTDVLSGCSKEKGIEILLRCMTPKWIAVDEITSPQDCSALLHACWCGARLICTAHADCLEDLYARPIYRPLLECQIFQQIVTMRSDKTWKLERVSQCT